MPKRIVHRLGFRYSNSTGPRYQQEISTHLSAAAVHGDTIETLRHLGAAAESLEQVGDPRLAETCEKKIQLANKLIGKGEKVDLEDLIKTHALRTNALRDMHAKADGTMHGDANVVIDACEKYLSCARRYKDKIHEIEALILKGACCIDCFNGRKKNKQHLDAAYASLEKALHLNQSNAPLSKREVNKHSILLQKSRISSALNDTSKSERLIKQAEACLILAKNSNAIPNREYYELSATCYGMTSDIYVSKKEYKRALELAEQNVANLRKLTIPSSHLPSALISLGEIYFALSRENESLIAYKEALKSGLLTIDDQDEVYNMIKQIEYIRGKRMELRALDEKLGRNMKKNECKDLLAEAYNICEAICDFTKGLVYLMRLLSLATNGEPSELANLYADIGMCHAEGNNIAEAIKWYEKGTRTYIEKTTNYFNCKIAQYGQYVIQGIKNYRSLRIMLMEISEEAVDVGNWQIRKNTLETMLLLDRNNQHQDNCNNTKAMIRTTESKIMENSRVLKPPESSSEDEGALRYHNRETAKATAKLKPSSSTAKYDFIASNSPLKLISPGRRKERMIVGLVNFISLSPTANAILLLNSIILIKSQMSRIFRTMKDLYNQKN